MDDEAVTRAALAAREGDDRAAEAFVRGTQDQVWRLLAHLADRAVAPDLVQETYERAFRSLPHYRAEAPARLWLLSIARRVAADHLRRRARRPVVLGLPAEDDEVADPIGATRAGDVAERVAVAAAVDALAPERREAFLLTQVLGLPYAGAAAVCGCPVGTIRSRVARARADLVEAIEAREATDPRGRRGEAAR